MLTENDRKELIGAIVEGFFQTSTNISRAKAKLDTARAEHATSGINKYNPLGHAAKPLFKAKAKVHNRVADIMQKIANR